MKRTYTPSQQLRLKLLFIWKSDNRGYDDFDSFYEAFYQVILDSVGEILDIAF